MTIYCIYECIVVQLYWSARYGRTANRIAILSRLTCRLCRGRMSGFHTMSPAPSKGGTWDLSPAFCPSKLRGYAVGFSDKFQAVKQMPGQVKVTTVIAVAGIVIAIVSLLVAVGVASSLVKMGK